VRRGADDFGRDIPGRQSNLEINGILLAKTTAFSAPPQEVIHRDKELVERDRCPANSLELAALRPVYYRMENRIKIHVFFCLPVLQIERLLRNRLQTFSGAKVLALFTLNQYFDRIGGYLYEYIDDLIIFVLFEKPQFGKPYPP